MKRELILPWREAGPLITVMKWIRTSRLSMQNSLSLRWPRAPSRPSEGKFLRPRRLVYLVIHDSGQVSFEHLLLSWYPSQIGPTGENPLSRSTLSLSTSGVGPVGRQCRTLSLFAGQGRRLGSRNGSTFLFFFFCITLRPRIE